MFNRAVIIIGLALASCMGANGQAVITHYLNVQPEPFRGGRVKAVIENHELMINDVAGQPFTVEKRYNGAQYIVSEESKGKASGANLSRTWEYDGQNRPLLIVTKQFVNILGWKNERIEFTYNDTTTFLQSIKVIKGDEVEVSGNVKCDDKGIPIYVEVFNNRGAHIATEKIYYLPANNLVKIMVYKINNQLSGITNIPLDKGKPFTHSSLKREYYSNGDIMLDSLDGNEKINQAYYYEYEYDSKGNWIVKTTYQVNLTKSNKIRNKKAEEKTNRQIIYS
ncbi:MAG: hypothetical protein RBS81_08330 [Tenuifilaceae bacterium]|jgi:hypothetical protein|nr:hypothetical protein [Tenuifilaceae bacterium]